MITTPECCGWMGWAVMAGFADEPLAGGTRRSELPPRSALTPTQRAPMLHAVPSRDHTEE